MKPLIGVISCHKDIRCTDAIRATWAKDSVLPVRFFLGQGTSPTRPDIVTLDCSDAYEQLPRKVQLAVWWARCNGFTEFFKLDDDAYCRPERLEVGINRFDYVGKLMPAKRGYDRGFCHGGAGYGLSSSAMDIVISTPIPKGEFSEDGFVANALAAHGIFAKHDLRFRYVRRIQGDAFPETPIRSNDIITSAEFAPSEFREVQRLWAGRSVEEQMSADDYKQMLKKSGQWRGL